MSTYIDRIQAMDACREALDWLREAGHPDLATAWAACERADWLLWLAAKCEPVLGSAPWSDARKPLVLAAAACAREALPVFEARSPGAGRPRRCIETTEAWCRGEATLEDVLLARRAAATAATATATAAAAAARAARRDCHHRMCVAIRAILPVPVLP